MFRYRYPFADTTTAAGQAKRVGSRANDLVLPVKGRRHIRHLILAEP